ncbi:MAG: DUF2254 domain-containing protein, partial [Aquihabitans sp.]
MLTVIGAVAAGAAALALDRRLDEQPGNLPVSLVTTVDGARALLSTIAGATIAFAGIAFSVSLLIIQQASSQYSPRVVHTLFRDPFNKRVLGLVVGTFTFCVIVLRSVRAPLEEGGVPIVPNVSVVIAMVLGISTILAIVAFIDHSAHSMDVSEILERVRLEATEHIQERWREVEPADRAGGTAKAVVPERSSGLTKVRFDRTGWVQQVNFDAILDSLEPGATLRLNTGPGRYAIAGTVLATIDREPQDLDGIERTINAAMAIGATRTMQQDAPYALRQIADVALKALSPGINDPTTAQDAIFHLAAVLGELLRRDPPQPLVTERDGACLIAAQQPTPHDLVRLAFAEVRRASTEQPAVCIYLLEAMQLVSETLVSNGMPDRAAPVVAEAERIVEGCRAANLIPTDRREIEDAYRHRFEDTSPQT